VVWPTARGAVNQTRKKMVNKKNFDSQFILDEVLLKMEVSNAELARRLGVTRQTVNNMVNGRRDVTVSKLHEIANALGIRVRDLFS
jgi:plasmid maintenance system antidote protein VapI